MKTLHWTPEAIQDREAIYDYIEVDNPSAALALDELFAEKAGRLLDHPDLGRPCRPCRWHPRNRRASQLHPGL